MDLNSEQLETVCRICLTKSVDMKDIFNVADIIMSCAPIHLEQGDGLPSTICSDCIGLARKSYEFRLLCEKSDNILRENLHKQNFVTIKTEKDDLIDSSDLHTDAAYSTFNKSLVTINNLNEIPKTEICDDYKNESFEIKTEFFEEDEDKAFKEYGDDLIADQSLSSTQIVRSVVNENIYYSSGNENSNNVNKVLFDNETIGSNYKQIYSCEYCGKLNTSEINLRVHQQRHLEGLKCNICDKDFDNLSRLRAHVYMHKRRGTYACSTCGKTYGLPENLAIHQRKHTGFKPYACKVCNKSFSQWNEIKSHEMNHTSEKPFLCSICGNKFARAVSLRNHTKRIHPNPFNERPYACTLCDKKFKVRYDLTKHMWYHSDERNHVCEVCTKAFKTKTDLYQHGKTHLAQKPHVCSICTRGFLQKHTLIRHLETHSKH